MDKIIRGIRKRNISMQAVVCKICNAWLGDPEYHSNSSRNIKKNIDANKNDQSSIEQDSSHKHEDKLL